jgi:hypothetical protein
MYGSRDGRWATTTMTGAETTMRGAATTTKAGGSLPPPPPPVAITRGPDPSSQYALCIAVDTADPPPPERRTTCLSLLSPRRLLSACAFRLSFASHSPLVCFDGWLLCHLLLRHLHLASRVAPPFPVHSMHGSIAVAPFALPSCRPSPSPLCCRRAVHCPRR